MKIQSISVSSISRKNNLKNQSSAPATSNSINNDLGQSRANQVSFAGWNIRKIFKPAAQSLDEALERAMASANITAKAEHMRPKLEPGSYTKILIDKINETYKRIVTLEEGLATGVKPSRVRDAESKLDFYHNWHDSIERENARARAAAAKEAERGNYWKGFKWMSNGDEVYEQKMAPYWENYNKYKSIEREKDNLKAIIEDYGQSQAVKEESIASAKREIAAYKAELTCARLGDFVNQTVNQRGGVNERIAGYFDVKDQLRKEFITPLIASKTDPSVKLPNAVVLYGATGVGKTEMLRGIEEECRAVANVVHFPMSTSNKDFKDVINSILAEARATHKDHKKRTILLIDEAEKYMCMSPNQARRFGSEFEADDFDVLNSCGREDTDNVRFLKSLLDRISEVPKAGENTSSATSLFITTNYPHLIDQDLMRRKGKFMPIAVKPAADTNLISVIRHYFKQNSDLLEEIKALSIHDNFENILNAQVRLSEKAKGMLIERKQKGTLGNLAIDHELKDWPNLEQFIKFTNPSNKRGAYSNVEIKDMIFRAFDQWMDNPTKPMYKYFFDIKGETVRDITPKRYSKFKSIYSMVNDKVETADIDMASKEFTDLIKSYQNGELNNEMQEAVLKRMSNIQEELGKLEALKKSGAELTEGEQMQYDLFKQWDGMWE